ncbi:unnamed protein product [Ectocarpus sp. 6 AP-2014]
MATAQYLLCASVQTYFRNPATHAPTPCRGSTTRRWRNTTQGNNHRPPHVCARNKARSHSTPLCTTKRPASRRGNAKFRASKDLEHKPEKKNTEGSRSTSIVHSTIAKTVRQQLETRCARNSCARLAIHNTPPHTHPNRRKGTNLASGEHISQPTHTHLLLCKKDGFIHPTTIRRFIERRTGIVLVTLHFLRKWHVFTLPSPPDIPNVRLAFCGTPSRGSWSPSAAPCRHTRCRCRGGGRQRRAFRPEIFSSRWVEPREPVRSRKRVQIPTT